MSYSKTSTTITPRQADVAVAIRDFRRRNGFAPTYREIGKMLGTKAAVVFEAVRELERKGVVRIGDKMVPRSISIVDESQLPPRQRLVFPVLGWITLTP